MAAISEQSILNSKTVIAASILNAKTAISSFFYTFIITIISLLLPISFILSARLSIGQQHIFGLTPLVHTLISLVTIGTLLQPLKHHGFMPPKCAWVFLCVFQMCVGLGIEATILADIRLSRVDMEIWWWDPRCALFFMGIYETTIFWEKAVVRVAVDDAFFGGVEVREVRIEEKMVRGLALGGLCWWLRQEVTGLLVLVETRGLIIVRVSFFSCLVYITTIVGLRRLIEGLWSLGKAFLCWYQQENWVHDDDDAYYQDLGNDRKQSQP